MLDVDSVGGVARFLYIPSCTQVACWASKVVRAGGAVGRGVAMLARVAVRACAPSVAHTLSRAAARAAAIAVHVGVGARVTSSARLPVVPGRRRRRRTTWGQWIHLVKQQQCHAFFSPWQALAAVASPVTKHYSHQTRCCQLRSTAGASSMSYSPNVRESWGTAGAVWAGVAYAT